MYRYDYWNLVNSNEKALQDTDKQSCVDARIPITWTEVYKHVGTVQINFVNQSFVGSKTEFCKNDSLIRCNFVLIMP